MILGLLSGANNPHSGGYAVIDEALQALRQWSEKKEWPEGRLELRGDQLYINFMSFDTKSPAEQVAEKHDQYLDIHYLIEGSEQIGWSPLREGMIPSQPYDEKDDYALYAPQADEQLLAMKPGMYAVFFPDDVHRPGMGDGSMIKKAVVKIHKALLT
ncbi:YhcH/YjgK/YiaL family protein [Paenibacillus sp. ATY16]|uniref:YhcH/YjgK/YiaL family protein n=1 Tax=Paenibacillus sp. ATY16 TaxID=1759312 RepID=UPI000E2F4BF3|nr:YhcH/YjgK/YiaL family protein [Paenibacillus sp. ATY16]MCK9857637.1 YhcH/YjgK/YiaL family protein [Paenibacillus sp. ATY16]